MSMAGTVPGGLGSMTFIEGLTTVGTPLTGAIAAWRAPEVEEAKGKALAQQVALEQAQAEKVDAQERAAAAFAFRMADALSLLQAARDRLDHRYRVVLGLVGKVQVAFAQEPDLDPKIALQAGRARIDADDLLASMTTTALPSEPEMVLAMASRINSAVGLMDVVSETVQDAVSRAEEGILAIQEERARVALAKQRQAVAAQQVEGSRLMDFFRKIGAAS